MNQEEILSAVRKLLTGLDEAFVMGTVSPDGKPHVFYMGAMVFEEPFTLYMETYRDSAKVSHIRNNPHVEVVVSSADYSQVATISGTATLDDSPQIRKKVWDRIALSGMYFATPDSQDFGVIKVVAKRVQLQTRQDSPRESHVVEV